MTKYEVLQTKISEYYKTIETLSTIIAELNRIRNEIEFECTKNGIIISEKSETTP